MPIESYVRSLIEPLLSEPGALDIKTVHDNMGILLSITVSPRDMGMIIGKAGETAKAIRLLTRVRGSMLNARVSIKIIEPEGGKFA